MLLMELAGPSLSWRDALKLRMAENKDLVGNLSKKEANNLIDTLVAAVERVR